MQLDLSDKEFETLLEAVLLGNFVVNAGCDEDTYDEEHSELINRMLNQAGLHEMRLVEKQEGGFVPTEEFSLQLEDRIESFMSKTLENAFDEEDFDESEDSDEDDEEGCESGSCGHCQN